jgi:hypothetical protein
MLLYVAQLDANPTPERFAFGIDTTRKILALAFSQVGP